MPLSIHPNECLLASAKQVCSADNVRSAKAPGRKVVSYICRDGFAVTRSLLRATRRKTPGAVVPGPLSGIRATRTEREHATVSTRHTAATDNNEYRRPLIFDFAQLCDGHAARSGRRWCHEIIGGTGALRMPLQNRVKLMDAGEVAWRRLTAYAVLCLSGWNLPPST